SFWNCARFSSVRLVPATILSASVACAARASTLALRQSPTMLHLAWFAVMAPMFLAAPQLDQRTPNCQPARRCLQSSRLERPGRLMTTLTRTIKDLVIANRILAMLGIVDAFGDVSARHPGDPTRFLLARPVSPAAV